MDVPRATPTLNPEWAKAQCPYCRLSFSYVLNSYYQPKTCSSYDCQRQYLHNVRPFSSPAMIQIPSPQEVL